MTAKDFNFEFGHLGFWHDTYDEAKKVVDLLQFLFDFNADVAGDYGWNVGNNRLEVINCPGKGTKGHFSIVCDDIENAIKYLEEKGIVFDDNTRTKNPDGILWKIFAKEEISGFAWHLALRGYENDGHA